MPSSSLVEVGVEVRLGLRLGLRFRVIVEKSSQTHFFGQGGGWVGGW